MPPPSIALARWVAEYYAAGPGETLALTLPPVARGRDHAFKTTRIAELTPAGRAAAAATPRQQAALAALAARGGRAPIPALAADGVSAAVVATLAKKGLVTIATATVDRDPLASPRALAAPAGAQPLAVTLTAEQQAALARLDALAGERRFAVAVLHGVTGSGKTQVYLRLADAVRKAGRRVLILVPEIALTPAMAALLRAAFGDQVAIQHSALSAGERHDQWHRIRRGDVSVVVGTRSAVFAPIEDLGLVVVDEEHDTSYKQDESPRYHGRDVAIVRAQQAGALAVLGSATPSLETFQHATSGHYTLVTLERRILDRPLASVRVVDMREVFAAEGPDTVLSPPLREALAARLADGEQSVVLLNRRGYAAAYFCRACAASLECPHCSITLTVHRAARRAVCHYCDHERPLPPALPVLRRRVPRLPRRRHRAHRGGGAGGAAGGAHRPRRSRHHAAARRHRRRAAPLRGARARRAGRHADDRQGARLPGGDAGRRRLGRHRARRRRFPRRRADVPAAHAGRRPRRPRHAARRGDHPDALSAALRRRARGAAGLRARSSRPS